jgi:secreted trypsin-like serine protease
MSLQFHVSIILVINAYFVLITQAARPDFLHFENSHKYHIRPKSTQDPDAIFRHDGAIAISSTQPRRRKLSSKENRTGRVANGQKAAKGQFPFVAYFDPEGVCTASLITPRAVLSAAHCVYEDGVWTKWSKSAIYMGSNDYYDYDMEEFGVKGAWIPDIYESDNGYGLYGDVSIVELTKAVPSSVGKPVTLASSATSLAGVTSLTLIGWGQLETGKMPDFLYYASLPYNPQKCMAIYNDLFKGDGPIEKDHICTGGGTDPLAQSCGGDSGGPTVLQRPGKHPVQIAITSYGYGSDKNCGKIAGENINVDTSVAYWRSFIEDILSYNNLHGATPPVRMNNIVYDTCYYQSSGVSVLKKVKMKDGYKCCDACRENTACKAWTHVAGSNVCYLLSGKGKGTKSKSCTSGWYK